MCPGQITAQMNATAPTDPLTGLILDVLQAEDAVNQARLRHASAITNYNKAQVDLLAALGLIDQTNVARSPKTDTRFRRTWTCVKPCRANLLEV
jgi:hypothetical protein